MNPAVSVVVPVYNVEQYLPECLDSLAAQTLRELEIVCVDDGSTDGAAAILARYASELPNLKVLSGPNGGYGKALNRGFAAATGEYVGLVDSDDCVEPDMFETLLRVARRNDLDFVKADFDRFRDRPGGRVFVREPLDKTGKHYGEVFDPSATPQSIRLTMNTWTGIYRRSFIERFRIRHNETPGASFQDNGFWWQTFIHARRAMILPRILYHNRRDNPGSSVFDPGKVFAMNVEYDWIRRLLEEDSALWERFKGVYAWKKFHNYRYRLGFIDERRRLDFIRRFGAEFREAFRRGEIVESEFNLPERLLLKAYANGTVAALERVACGFRFLVPRRVRAAIASVLSPAVQSFRRLVRRVFP